MGNNVQRAPAWDSLDIGRKPPKLDPNLDLINGTQQPRCIADFDLDGTLVQRFTMGKWVRFCEEHKIGKQWARETILQSFLNHKSGPLAFLDAREGEGYEDFIRKTANLYAQMLEGYRQRVIQQIGAGWSAAYLQKDPSTIFDFSVPIIKLLQSLGIEPVLQTGAPAEVLQGYKRALGIKTAYGLELEVNKGGLYTGMVRHNTGLSHVKSVVARKIKKAGHAIIFAAGDRISDAPLLNAALQNEIDGVRGTALLIHADVPTTNLARTIYGHELNAGRLLEVREGTSRDEVVRRVRFQLEKVVDDPENAIVLAQLTHLKEIRNRLSRLRKQ